MARMGFRGVLDCQSLGQRREVAEGPAVNDVDPRYLTAWRPASEPPERAGWYEVSYNLDSQYAKWDGLKWLKPVSWAPEARGAFRLNSEAQLVVVPMALLMQTQVRCWRGLTFDAGHASDEHLNLRLWYEPEACIDGCRLAAAALAQRLKAEKMKGPTFGLARLKPEGTTLGRRPTRSLAPLHHVVEPLDRKRVEGETAFNESLAQARTNAEMKAAEKVKVDSMRVWPFGPLRIPRGAR